LSPLLQPVLFVWQASTPRSEKEGNENSNAPFIARALRDYSYILREESRHQGVGRERKKNRKRKKCGKKKVHPEGSSLAFTLRRFA
jgi:hypothetical protein